MYSLESTSLLKKIMKDYFQSFNVSKKIAWCTSVGPAELLRSFGFQVYFPENHGALLGATRLAGENIPATINLGYSGDICSYLTSDIGAYLNKQTPLLAHYGLNSIPKPDLIVYNTNQCREVQDWFNFYAREFNCPIVGIFSPRHIDEMNLEMVTAVAEQFKAIIPICEKTSGVDFDIDRFSEVIRLSRESAELWKLVLDTGKNSPCPLSFFDASIHMGPIVVLRGTKIAIEYYQVLLRELQHKISLKQSPVIQEDSRIYWDGMPIWGKLRSLSNLFVQNNSMVVASTYCSSWIFDSFDENSPFESSAFAYTNIFINRSENAKLRLLKQWVEMFRIDGVIFHDAKTCFNNSNSRFGLPQLFHEITDIPVLIIEGDLCDLRFYSEGQTTTKLETFIEQLKFQKVLNQNAG
ncbi:MAG: 2-hydroxyacyl-CoA dehydratase [Saprospiraceae bacterium]|nr:2-hydroxyacyl-CoA dehydratase [Saprospiraceae bacterium]